MSDVGAVIAVAARRRDEGAGAPVACAGTAGSVTASASAAAMKIVRVMESPSGLSSVRVAPTVSLSQGGRIVSWAIEGVGAAACQSLPVS